MSEIHPNLQVLRTGEDLERVLDESMARPVLIFKYSSTCGTSAYALDELLTYLPSTGDDVGYAIVTVQTHRAVSDAIVKALGVRHESPQALLVRNRQLEWAASHYRVTASELSQAIEQLISQPPVTTASPTER